MGEEIILSVEERDRVLELLDDYEMRCRFEGIFGSVLPNIGSKKCRQEIENILIKGF
jgi:hypothetical protein